MIQDLLDVRRMESGRLGIETKPESPASLINDTVEMLRPLAIGSTIILEADVADDLPLVVADAARIQQVLSNLVGNAVKFTPRDGHVTVCAERSMGEFGLPSSIPGPGFRRTRFRTSSVSSGRRCLPIGAESGWGWRSRRGSSRRTAE